MRVVFSKLQNCADFNDGDFKDGGSAFQHLGPETAKAREQNEYWGMDDKTSHRLLCECVSKASS